MIKRHPAFTMIELIMVIVVLGILASLALPKLDKDFTQEAADNILSNMRYTQHMALMDDRQEFNKPSWQKSFWQISFQQCSDNAWFLNIGSDADYDGSLDADESAIDPATGKTMYWDKTNSCSTLEGTEGSSPMIFLSAKYGITNIENSSSCQKANYPDKKLAFDHLGRPHTDPKANGSPNFSTYISTECSYTFTLENEESFTIDIQPETGSMKIHGQKNS